MKTVLGRDPVLIIETVKALLATLAVLAVPALTADVQAAFVAFLYAGLGAVQAFAVHPIAPGVFSAVIGAGAVLALHFGYEVSSETTAAVVAGTSAVVALLVRGAVTPVDHPAR